MKRIIYTIVLTIFLIGISAFAFNIKPAKTDWTGTVYIRADGTIDPEGAPIQRNGDVYTLTDNITSYNDAIIIERDNILLDGAGFVIQSSPNAQGYYYKGIAIQHRRNVTICNMKIIGFGNAIYSANSSHCSYFSNKIKIADYGIHVINSHNNLISKNTIETAYCIYLEDSHFNVIDDNTLANFTTYDIAYGIVMLRSHNNSFIENRVERTEFGIYIIGSNNTISGNRVVDNQVRSIKIDSPQNVIQNNYVSGPQSGQGIHLDGDENFVSGNRIVDVDGEGITIMAFKNIICNNEIEGCDVGICIKGRPIGGEYPKNNKIFANIIKNNWHGVGIADTSTNFIYHNNFIGNALNVDTDSSVNIWDDGYPSGGNFWSNYVGTDTKSGIYQNKTGSDGIGDKACSINSRNQDRYPLMAPFNKFDAGIWNSVAYNVEVISNSTVSSFYFNPDGGAFLRFNVTGDYGTMGFCRVTIPKSLMWVEDGWTITIGDQPITNYLEFEDENFTYLYFTYNHSTKTVTIQGTHVIPEFPPSLILPLLMISPAALILSKRKLKL
ncbi:MAG: NosD domain-containing protein [Candidatus Bathyarchaeia archaeon]